ncbi:MAG: hypothetical protein NTY38_27885, partial [Acidobacteria bacterium]|nr:hypothetical protein [Acidobacteriota bacterium]
LGAQPLTVEVRHRHLKGGAAATLTFTESELRLEEPKHARTWKYEEIQLLELKPEALELRTYDDVRWQFGRDHSYSFDRLKADDAKSIYRLLAVKLDERLAARVAQAPSNVLWEAPAKLLRRTGGTNGDLRIGTGEISFAARGRGESRTWRYRDIQNFSRGGPLELTVGETRLQLKREMTEQQYNELWLRINRASGLQTFGSILETHHD